MRLKLFLAIQAAKRYKKKHQMPDVIKVTEEDIRKAYEENLHKDLDCFKVDQKLRRGFKLEKVDLPNCGGWLASKPENPADKILYYIHGGGFHGGSTKERFEFISYAVQHFHYNIFSIDYRLAPQYKCLEAIRDCEDGYTHLLKTYQAKNIVLLGESAGGNLVLALPQKLRDDGIEMPGGIIASSPVCQFDHYAYSYYECSQVTDFGIMFGINDTIESYRGDLPLNHPYLAPLHGDLSSYPSVYLDASSCESLRDEARMMYVRLKEEGTDVEYHELKDFFHAMLPAAKYGYVRREEYPHVLRFIDRVLNN